MKYFALLAQNILVYTESKPGIESTYFQNDWVHHILSTFRASHSSDNVHTVIQVQRFNVQVSFQAIHDGVIEATIDHEHGFIQSKETVDIYSTREPMDAFHQRITFCLDIYNQSVKAMRFPPKSYNKDLESAEVCLFFRSCLWKCVSII